MLSSIFICVCFALVCFIFLEYFAGNWIISVPCLTLWFSMHLTIKDLNLNDYDDDNDANAMERRIGYPQHRGRQACAPPGLPVACNPGWSPPGTRVAAGCWSHTGWKNNKHYESCLLQARSLGWMWGGWEGGVWPADLVGDDVQLYYTAGPGSGLLTHDVKHFPHKVLHRDGCTHTQTYYFGNKLGFTIVLNHLISKDSNCIQMEKPWKNPEHCHHTVGQHLIAKPCGDVANLT